MGWVGLLGSVNGLRQATLPQPSAEEARHVIGIDQQQVSSAASMFRDVVKRLKAYFEGDRVFFPDRLDLTTATPFQRSVWTVTKSVPYGETRSYRWVAELISNSGASRAVGQALGKNPLPIIIPCHRLVSSDGRLGGFTGGLTMKRRLLQLEVE